MDKINNEIVLFDKNGRKVIFRNFEEYSAGKCANIYRNNNILLKKYQIDCTYSFYLSKRVFYKLQELDIPNIVKLYDYYYYYPNLFYRCLPMDSYTMEYVRDDKINILLKNREYLLKTIYLLEKAAKKLAINKIKIIDAHRLNVVFNREGATLIDVDLYTIDRLMPFQGLLLYNQSEIVSLIVEKIKSELEIYDVSIRTRKLNYLYDIDLKHRSLSEEIDKLFTEDTLIDSVKAHLK